MAIFWKLSPNKKMVTAQKSSKICFYIILGGQKHFFNFSKKIFLGHPLEKKIFPKAKNSYFDTLFGLLLHLTPKMASKSI